MRGPAERETKNGEPLFELTNAATVMECTGLIQVPPENEEELESYEDVYHFSQPEPLPPKDTDIGPNKG
ncbi:MAG: hypothetical protein J6A56_03750 [Clostridia bacterium]|nr:hypothetical protein [Clostridia bacterium]